VPSADKRCLDRCRCLLWVALPKSNKSQKQPTPPETCLPWSRAPTSDGCRHRSLGMPRERCVPPGFDWQEQKPASSVARVSGVIIPPAQWAYGVPLSILGDGIAEYLRELSFKYLFSFMIFAVTQTCEINYTNSKHTPSTAATFLTWVAMALRTSRPRS
jgi:hypothetical protein